MKRRLAEVVTLTPRSDSAPQPKRGAPAEVINLAAYRGLRQTMHRPDLALRLVRLQAKRKGAAK